MPDRHKTMILSWQQKLPENYVMSLNKHEQPTNLVSLLRRFMQHNVYGIACDNHRIIILLIYLFLTAYLSFKLILASSTRKNLERVLDVKRLDGNSPTCVRQSLPLRRRSDRVFLCTRSCLAGSSWLSDELPCVSWYVCVMFAMSVASISATQTLVFVQCQCVWFNTVGSVNVNLKYRYLVADYHRAV